MERIERMPGSRRSVFLSSICIFERTKLILSQNFPDGKFLGTLEDIKDKLLELNSIGTIRLNDFTIFSNKWNLLLGNVMFELGLISTILK